MRPYEVVYIIDPKIDGDEAVDAVVNRVSKIVTDNGGQVTNVDKWGRRRLAYEINGSTEGYYVVMQFTAEPAAASELERLMKISDDIVRHLLVRQAV